MLEKFIKDLDTLHVLLEITRVITSSLDADRVNKFILESVMKILDADCATLFLLEETTQKPMLAAAEGFDENQIKNNLDLMATWEKVNEEVLNSKKSLIVNDPKEAVLFGKSSMKSFLSIPIISEATIIGILNIGRSTKKDYFTDKDESILNIFANHASIALFNAKLYKGLKDLYVSAVKCLAAAIDAKDPYTHGHSERVMRRAVAIGRAMHLSSEFLEDLRLAALLHDVGKIGIPETILRKPKGLTDEERTEINRHPSLGVRIIEPMINSHRIIPGIKDHHEHYDGSGYPEGLKGEETSLQGRIIAIADTFDALVIDRPYHKSLTNKEAFFEVKRNSGTQFDPKVVDAFVISFSIDAQEWQ